MHAHIHTQGQFRIISLPNMDVFEENPCRHGVNMHNSSILKGLSSPYNKQMKARHFTFGKRIKSHYYLKHVFLGVVAI